MHTELFRRATTRPTRMSAVVAGLVLTASLGAAPAAPRAAAPARTPGAVTNLSGEPEAVTVLSRSDAWAAQGFDVMLHWNGTAWSKVPITNAGKSVHFNSVSGDSPSDVWTVGELFGQGAVLEHWNGTAWTKAAKPAGLSGSELFGVSTVSSSDAWAVGDTFVSGAGHSVILHWNGSKWSLVSSPHASGASLSSVTALSASDAWAIGTNGQGHPIVLHWNGTNWSPVATPKIADLGLTSISADSASDAWAVGLIDTAPPSTVALHWNGSTWSRVTTPAPTPSPNPASGGAELVGVDAVSPTLAFAVGWYNTYPIHGGASVHAHTLLLQWNGSRWTQVPSPGLGVSFGPGSFLQGVAASSRSDAWAVGSYDTGGLEGPAPRTLMMHWNGSTWARG